MKVAAPPEEAVMVSIAARRNALRERRKEVQDQLGRIRLDRTNDRDLEGRDCADPAFEVATDAVLDRLESSILTELGRIENAMSHLDRGRGNTCECCGKIIDHKRLLTVIHATQCRACARVFLGVPATPSPDVTSAQPNGVHDGRRSPGRPGHHVGPTSTRP